MSRERGSSGSARDANQRPHPEHRVCAGNAGEAMRLRRDDKVLHDQCIQLRV